MVTANGTVVNNDIPGPQSNSVPLNIQVSLLPKVDDRRDRWILKQYLFDLKLLLPFVGTFRLEGSLALGRGLDSGFLHLHISHVLVFVLRIVRRGFEECEYE